MTAEEFFKANVGGAVQVTDRNGVATKGRLMEIRPAATLSGSVTFYLGLDPVGQPRQFFWFDNHTWAVASQPAPAAPAVLTRDEFVAKYKGKLVGAAWSDPARNEYLVTGKLVDSDDKRLKLIVDSWACNNVEDGRIVGTPAYINWELDNGSMVWSGGAEESPAPKKDNPFPHKCGACGNPAYIGAQFVECSIKWCDGITKIRRAG